MNNIFSMRRFGLLLKKHWIEKRKGYLIGLAAYTAILMVCYIFAAKNDAEQDGLSGSFRENLQYGLYFAGLFIGGAIYAGLMFTDYNRKETAVFNLLLPASHLEKALVYIFYGVFFFWIAYTACYLLIDSVGVFVLNNPNVKLFFPLQPDKSDELNVYIVNLIFLFTQILLVLGSIFFQFFSFFKTAIAMVVIALLVLLTVRTDKVSEDSLKYGLTKITSSSYESGPLYEFYSTWIHKSATFSPPVIAGIYIAIVLLFAGICSAIYLRLKEKEI